MTYGLKPKSESEARPGLRPGLSPRAAMEDFRRRLVRYAVKLVWNRDDGEEIVQDAFKLAMSKGPTATEGDFGPWMFRTVSNLAMNLRRKRRPEPLASWIGEAPDASPTTAIQKAEELERLRGAIARLPERQRMAVVLRLLEQMDYDSIAEVMELSLSAVRAQVHLGRRRLAEWMAADSEDVQ